MLTLLEAIASWPTLLLIVTVFGFAPGLCLRLIVLIYPCSDSRRSELIAELYAHPRIQRPVWVAQQLEVALFEVLAIRLKRRPPQLECTRPRAERTRSAHFLLAIAARLLPPSERARYVEEFRAELLDVPPTRD
jgi:hypothetical protein